LTLELPINATFLKVKNLKPTRIFESKNFEAISAIFSVEFVSVLGLAGLPAFLKILCPLESVVDWPIPSHFQSLSF